jgi:hypothetical protein
MSFLSKLFGNKTADNKESKTGGMEDFMTLIRVYFQAVLASELNITNIASLPDLRVFKTTLRIPTQGGKLGIGERKHCRKMLMEMYEMDEQFFKEIDQSIRRNCKKLQDVQPYMYRFQGYIQGIMMLAGNLMSYKMRLPGFFKKMLYQITEKTVSDIFNKNDFTDASVVKTVVEVREINKHLAFSQKWTADFIYKVVMLSKKEKQPQAAAE